LKVNDENRRIRIRIRIRIQVRGMDPRIRIHTKMSWIRNTGTSLLADEAASITSNFVQQSCKNFKLMSVFDGAGKEERLLVQIYPEF
jgi:hypothetical protein